jgi:hypothetical protein
MPSLAACWIKAPRRASKGWFWLAPYGAANLPADPGLSCFQLPDKLAKSTARGRCQPTFHGRGTAYMGIKLASRRTATVKCERWTGEPADPDAEPGDDPLTALLGLAVHEVGRRACRRAERAANHFSYKSSDLIVKFAYYYARRHD